MASLLKLFDFREISRKKRRRFIFDIVLGTLLIVLFVLTKNTSLRQSIINNWFDSHIAFRASTMKDLSNAYPSLHALLTPGADEKADDLTFLAFSEASVRKMGRPDFIPRDKIADLVNIAYEKGAKLIIIDMLLIEPDNSPEKIIAGDSIPLSGAERDDKLRAVLQKIKDDKDSDTKVLIPLASYYDKTLMRNILQPSANNDDDMLDMNNGMIDGKKIYAVTPNISVSQNNIVRFWLPYSIIKIGDEERVLWSIPMMTLYLSQGRQGEMQSLEQQILHEPQKEDFLLKLSDDGRNKQFKFYREHMARDGVVRDTTALQYNRIQYGLIPPDVTQKDTEIKEREKTSEGIPFSRNPLGNINPNQVSHWVSGENHIDNKKINCKGKIVIIGREDRDSGDIFHTLTGNMPGMYVHGNSIATVLAQTQPHLAPAYKQVVIDFVFVFITAFAFLRLGTWKGGYIVFLLAGIFWLFSYVYFLLTNELLYISFAFTSIGVYTWLNNMEAFFGKRKTIKEILWRDEHE